MATNDKYQLILVAQLQKTAIANTFYVNVLNDTGTSDTADSIHTQFRANILSKLKLIQSSQVEYECMLIRKLVTRSEPAIMFPLTEVGSRGTTVLPSNLTCCINTWSSDGRAPYRGRWFISGLLEEDVEDGRWMVHVETALSQFMEEIKDSWGPSGEVYQLNHFSEAQGSYDPLTRGRIAAIPRKLRNRTPGLCSIG